MNEQERLTEQRRKLFKQLDWLLVIAPPILALVVGCVGAFLVAAVVPIPNTSFWGRWALGVLVILGLPTLAFVIKSWYERSR